MKIALSVLAAVLLCAAARAGDEENPYAKCKVGDWTKFKVTETKTTDKGPVTTEREVTFTVIAKTADEVQVEAALNLKDGTVKKAPKPEIIKLADKLDLFKSVKRPPQGIDSELTVTGQGDEQVDVGGKKIQAHRTDAQIVLKGKGAWSDVKIWISPDVPLSGKVKFHQELAKSTTDMELVGFGSATPPAATAKAGG